MKSIIEINEDEILAMLGEHDIQCDELWFQGGKWSYYGGFAEGESKWLLRLTVNAEYRFKTAEGLGSFEDRGSICIPPHAAIEYLACAGDIEPGEYLIWKAW